MSQNLCQKGEAKAPQSVIPTVKHRGGYVRVWICFSGPRLSGLHREEPKTNRNYGILSSLLLFCCIHLVGQGLILQQHNDSK